MQIQPLNITALAWETSYVLMNLLSHRNCSGFYLLVQIIIIIFKHKGKKIEHIGLMIFYQAPN